MTVLADTNVLLRSLYPEHPQYSAAENALAALRLRGDSLCMAPQNLIEFWAVATRSRADNGLGMSTPEVLEAWQSIVADLGILGKQTHDAHLAAIMRVNSVTSILTFNTNHFRRFPGMTVLDPAKV